MASRVKFTFSIALFIVLVAMAAAAHEGHHHIAPAEPPAEPHEGHHN